MDKNIAALLNEEAFTIKVRFVDPSFTQEDQQRKPASLNLGMTSADAMLQGRLSQREYTYVATDRFIVVGDFVVVPTRDLFHVAYVSSVDEDLDIEPNETVEYKWVVSKLDLEDYKSRMEKVRDIKKTLSVAYKQNTRKQFASLLISSLDEETRVRLGFAQKKEGEPQ